MMFRVPATRSLQPLQLCWVRVCRWSTASLMPTVQRELSSGSWVRRPSTTTNFSPELSAKTIMTIIVTGAAGFIGSNIVKALNERGEQRVIAVDNLTRADKFKNLVDCEVDDYLDKTEFVARFKRGDWQGQGDFPRRRVFGHDGNRRPLHDGKQLPL